MNGAVGLDFVRQMFVTCDYDRCGLYADMCVCVYLNVGCEHICFS